MFLEHAPERQEAEALALRIADRADQTNWFNKEPHDTKYGITPLQLCPSPDAIARAAFSDGLLDAHLDALADRQQEDGGWPISWTAPSDGATLEWRGRVTIDALCCLRAYGRI
jgi:hypothetical protein